ncbi:hypothetical protein KIW84_041276 [Lathyrus oleraceus]|uniref:Uncharacterized protein n=1 Tax=Pisum sativum TaxID=3888 RepID=A0A9D5AQY4_PEA|nr:hypothetical protein KIW84_041276 [Pisum sativum]
MILDALLKTKSRAVLNDVISKNGLQMSHKIMKQYRQDFKKKKGPILRKLLKVLEYLAAGKVLTPEHIKSGPPCRGMESFRESMLSLTEHDDKQRLGIGVEVWVLEEGVEYIAFPLVSSTFPVLSL